MNLDERVVEVFRGGQPDVMPWIGDLTYWYDAAMKSGNLPERYKGVGVVDLYRDLGCCAHEHCLSKAWITEYDDEVLYDERYEYNSAGEPAFWKVEWQTPIGTLSSERIWEPSSFSWAYPRRPVSSVAELAIVRFVYEHKRFKPDYAAQNRFIEPWKGVGVPCSYASWSPMADLIVNWMGVEGALYALADAPAEIDRTVEVMSDAEDAMYDIIAKAPSPLVYFADNITSQVVSPRIFNTYYAPYYRRRLPQLHAAGKRIFLHVDGTFRPLLPHVARSGVDCAQSLVVAPVGDVAVSELRELAGPDLILWSGVPGALFSPLYPEQMVRDVVMDCIKYHKDYGRFIIGVCDQVPPDGAIERVRMVADLVEEYGRY